MRTSARAAPLRRALSSSSGDVTALFRTVTSSSPGVSPSVEARRSDPAVAPRGFGRSVEPGRGEFPEPSARNPQLVPQKFRSWSSALGSKMSLNFSVCDVSVAISANQSRLAG